MTVQQIDERPVVNMTIPAKHMKTRLVGASQTYLLGSRGSLKTTLGVALYCIDMIYQMPRSTGVAVVLNYEHFNENTQTPLLKGFAMLGYREGEHFVVRKRPPEDWPRPYDYNGENDFKQTITWHNGTQIKILSLARLAAANAISAQWGFFDELKFMKPEALDEVFPIFRGNEEYFADCSMLYSKFFATDKLADPAEIDWILKKREQQDLGKIEEVASLQTEVNQLKRMLYRDDITRKNRGLIEAEISFLEKELKSLRNGLVYVPEINCYDVLPILGEKWLSEAQALARTKRVFKVAYENQDPERAGESFYPSFSELQEYDTIDDEDIDYTSPFIGSLDYQHTVAPFIVSQIAILPGEDTRTLNTIDYLYTLYPGTLRQVVKDFCTRYANHLTKKIYYIYDHTAIGKRVDAEEYFKIVCSELQANDWQVEQVYTGQAPDHYQKYTDMDDCFKEENPDQMLKQGIYRVRMHRRRCAKLIKAIKAAGAVTVSGKTQKDKKYENPTNYPHADQSVTTHCTDAFDTTFDAVNKQRLIATSSRGTPIATR